jgi:hypothetical protein
MDLGKIQFSDKLDLQTSAMVNLNLETLGIPPTVIGHLNERMPATKSWIVLCRFGSQKKKHLTKKGRLQPPQW